MGGNLRSLLRAVHGGRVAMDDESVDAVLDVGRGVGRTEKTRMVRLILGEQQRYVGVAI